MKMNLKKNREQRRKRHNLATHRIGYIGTVRKSRSGVSYTNYKPVMIRL